MENNQERYFYMTDTELKQALAKMLPEHLTCAIEGSFNRGTVQKLRWANLREVLDTELLHLCWLVETQQIPDDRWMHYASSLGCVSATWQQRVKALMKVKNL